MYSPFRYDCVYAYQHSDKKKYLMFAYNDERHKDLIIPITDAPWFCDPRAWMVDIWKGEGR